MILTFVSTVKIQNVFGTLRFYIFVLHDVFAISKEYADPVKPELKRLDQDECVCLNCNFFCFRRAEHKVVYVFIFHKCTLTCL